MKHVCERICHGYTKTIHGLEWLAPVSLLLFRLWVALDFFRAGLVKISDMNSTIYLFQSTYQVPLLPPVAAAYLGTGIELIMPWFIAFGLLGRPFAAFLFIYNIIAVISYPDLWPNGLWKDFWHGGFTDHKVWALMLLAIVLYGPGRLSLDYALNRWLLPRFGRAPSVMPDARE